MGSRQCHTTIVTARISKPWVEVFVLLAPDAFRVNSELQVTAQSFSRPAYPACKSCQ